MSRQCYHPNTSHGHTCLDAALPLTHTHTHTHMHTCLPASLPAAGHAGVTPAAAAPGGVRGRGAAAAAGAGNADILQRPPA